MVKEPLYFLVNHKVQSKKNIMTGMYSDFTDWKSKVEVHFLSRRLFWSKILFENSK